MELFDYEISIENIMSACNSIESKRAILKSIFSKEESLWLEKLGMLTCPAAMKHHCNYEGGLFIHSFVVAMELQNITDKLGLKWDRADSALRVGMLHDVCKTDDYYYYKDNDFHVSYNDKKTYSGHGSKSVVMLAGNIKLTEQEKLCICYHMGAFVDKEEWPLYSRACAKDPNVLYTHTADMIASQVRGV